jgi:hypothetical protein
LIFGVHAPSSHSGMRAWAIPLCTALVLAKEENRKVNTSVLYDADFEAELRLAARHTDLPGTHVAVVVPICSLCPADTTRLEAALQRWSQPQTKACIAGDSLAAREAQTFETTAAAAGCEMMFRRTDGSSHAHLLIYSDVLPPAGAADTIAARVNAAISPVLPCFRGISFVSARLAPSDNTYPRAPNLMFYKLSVHLIRLQRFHYFLILEADVTPLQPDWLSYLAAFVPPRAARFWVKGSTARGALACQACKHINGNALYHASDPEFGRLLEQLQTSQARFEEKKHSRRIGFDAALHYRMLARTTKVRVDTTHRI